ncbi:MAG: hypothetical protein GY804_15160 [Alphaproteobacteria bacterium]|nr:hypothetical protein [Actinomycetes bacterium]MCP4395585.1 hypothetical protein [Alphaproteobacteria bacterium]
MAIKTYVTFGQNHSHVINGRTLDKDTVAVITSDSAEDGREKAFELFGRQFCMEHPEDFWDSSSMKYYPKGYVEVN